MGISKQKLLLIFFTIDVIYASQKIPWWYIKAAQQQGPNVCVVEELAESGRKFYTECRYWKPRSICGEQAVVRYDCCEGYQMVPGQLGCTGVKPLTNLSETAREAGAGKFADLLESSGVAEELKRGSAVTLFAPTDKAFENYMKIRGIRPEKLNGTKYRNLVLYHLVDKKIPSTQWGADLLLDSKLPERKLRLNRYSNGMETVNCDSIIRKNQQATDGVVHVIDSVLDPSFFENNDITEVIANDGRFAVLAEAMKNSDFINRIRNSSVPHTVFAPSDEAFQKIHRSRLNKILGNKESVEALLANHVVTHPICLPGIISEHHAKTLGPQKLTLNCDSKGTTVDKRKLRRDFIQGVNGLLYLIDDVLLPDKAKTIMELANDKRLYKFMELIKEAGLEESFNNFESYTLFAPSEAAMYSLPESDLELMLRDPELVKEFILNHAVVGKHTTNSIYDGQVVMSLDEKTPLRLQVYRGSVGIEDALIEDPDTQGSNGVLHIIDKVLRPNTHPLDDVLRTNGNFSIWLAAMDKMREVQPETFEEFRRRESSYTYFVPSDEAFKDLGDAKLQKLLGDSKYLSQTLKNHVAENMMASSGFKSDLRYAVKSKRNVLDVVKQNQTMKVNDAMLTKCDLLNQNGVAHQINKVLLPRQKHGYSKRKRGIRRARRNRFSS